MPLYHSVQPSASPQDTAIAGPLIRRRCQGRCFQVALHTTHASPYKASQKPKLADVDIEDPTANSPKLLNNASFDDLTNPLEPRILRHNAFAGNVPGIRAHAAARVRPAADLPDIYFTIWTEVRASLARASLYTVKDSHIYTHVSPALLLRTCFVPYPRPASCTVGSLFHPPRTYDPPCLSARRTSQVLGPTTEVNTLVLCLQN